MALEFSTLPKTKNKMKILGRKLSEEEKQLYIEEDIIESNGVIADIDHQICQRIEENYW